MTVEEFLKKQKVPYVKRHHPEAFTAQEVAAASHVPGARMLKAVVVRAGDGYALAVCPATHKVNTVRLEKLVGRPVRIANEGEMEEVLADTEIGAEAPIGNLYGIATYADKSVAESGEIVFQAGSHTDVLEMSYSDFAKVAQPVTGQFAEHI